MATPVAPQISVEVVFAEPQAQSLVTIQLENGATVADAIEQSGLAAKHSGSNLAEMPTGIWGRVVDRDHVLSDGDRVETYRELRIDPREARRQLALAGRTMREGDDDGQQA